MKIQYYLLNIFCWVIGIGSLIQLIQTIIKETEIMFVLGYAVGSLIVMFLCFKGIKYSKQKIKQSS